MQIIADPIRFEIVRILAQRPMATAPELAAAGVSSEPTLRRHLEALLALGLLESHEGESDGVTPGRPPTRFRLRRDLLPSVRAVLRLEH